MRNRDLCKGCRYYATEDDTMCGGDSIRNGEVCPCVECLIKPMCTSVCDLFAIYIHNERYTQGDEL